MTKPNKPNDTASQTLVILQGSQSLLGCLETWCYVVAFVWGLLGAVALSMGAITSLACSVVARP